MDPETVIVLNAIKNKDLTREFVYNVMITMVIFTLKMEFVLKNVEKENIYQILFSVTMAIF